MPSASSTSPRSNSPSEAELIEQLSAIGYLAATKEAGDSQGVTVNDSDRTAPGLNLMTSGHGPVALLMRMDGTVVHEWRADFDQVFPNHPRSDRGKEARRNFWRAVILYPNGDLVVIWELFGIFKLDHASRLIWVVPEPAHHDVQLNDLGQIVHLQSERKMIAGIPERQAIEDFIVVRDSEGVEQNRLAMSDALENVNWLKLRRSFWTRAKDLGYGLKEHSVYDPFHTNSLSLLTETEADQLGDSFKAGDALVSMGMLDTLAIIDMDKGRTLWSQQGPYSMQHSPRFTAKGHIVLFNNFVASKKSSVVTIDPRTRRIVGDYRGPDSQPLYSRRSGQVQVLPNGNTLVVETDGGRALEITDKGEVVWEFHSPYRVKEGKEKVAHLYSLKRVDESQTSWLSPKQ